MRTIKIGGRPLGKVLAAFWTAVGAVGAAAVLDALAGDFDLGGRGWGVLLVASFGPPLAAYLRRLSAGDLEQIAPAAAALARQTRRLGG